MKVTALSDAELVGALKKLVASEHVATADVVEHLAEIDARRLHITAACASLTAYCEERLGYSHDEAAHRVHAARQIQKYPMILPMLRAGQINLSTVRLLSPVLDASNHRERLEAAIGRTRYDLQRMIAGWAPKPDLPTRMTPLPSNEPPALLAMMTAAADTEAKTGAVPGEKPAMASQPPRTAQPLQPAPPSHGPPPA